MARPRTLTDEQRRANKAEYQRKYRAAKGADYLEKARAFYHKNKHRQDRKAMALRHKYGIDRVEYDGMLSAQGGLCAICASPLVSPQVDHCHTTGAVRGLLCRPCNTGIGLLKDNTQVLAAAIRYLENTRG